MRVRFGINFMPTAPPREVVEWAKAVEELAWLADRFAAAGTPADCIAKLERAPRPARGNSG